MRGFKCYLLFVSGDFMRLLLFVLSLAIVLVALPANAQLGPAGVPGAPGLAETDPSLKPVPANQPAPPFLAEPQPASQASACSKGNTTEQCKTRKAKTTRKKPLDTCKNKAGAARKQCLTSKIKNIDCSKSRDPERCELFQKTREQCKDQLGREHRQCLRDNLSLQK